MSCGAPIFSEGRVPVRGQPLPKILGLRFLVADIAQASRSVDDERNDDTAVYYGLFGWLLFVFPEVRLYPSAEIREVAAFGLRIDVRFCGWYIAGRICGFDGLRVGAFSSGRPARDSCPEMSVIRNLCGVKPNARNQTPPRAYTKWIPSSVLCRHDRQCGTGTTFRGEAFPQPQREP